MRTSVKLTLSRRLLHTVVMIRHGESTWNREKRFTGWCDIPLTENGEADAKDAGALMGERGMQFDIAFTSTLERAWRTCAIVLSAAGQSDVDTVKSWRLNERHYGALQGHLKACPRLTEVFGEEKLIEWRRSYDTAPPSLDDNDFIEKIGRKHFEQTLSGIDPSYLDDAMRFVLSQSHSHSLFNEKSFLSTPPSTPYYAVPRRPVLFSSLHPQFPFTESLKQCEERAYGYWTKVIGPQVKAGKRVLIVAHANTIRALVKSMDNISDEMIAHLKIPNGIPLVYTLDANLQPMLEAPANDLGFQASYLVSARNHSKMMAYERCTTKKLIALFEYLDQDKNGRIDRAELQSGINKLQSNRREVLCEYEVEELLRCIPDADEKGGVTLQAFLDSEATIMPSLTRLRLLQ